MKVNLPVPEADRDRRGLSRLCSATFEQLLAFGATFCGFSNLEQVLPFRAIFEQNIGFEIKTNAKKSRRFDLSEVIFK